MLRPNGSASLVAGWAASATTLHGDTDEAIPDGAYAQSSTLGSRFELTMSNPSATYTEILGVRVYVRAKVLVTGANDSVARMRLFQYDGVTLYTVEDFEVWSYQVDEADFWYDFSFLLEKNFVDEKLWEDSDLDDLRLAFQFVSGSSGISYYHAPTSISSNTGWTDASDGGAAVFGDVVLGRETVPALLSGTYPSEVYTSVKAPNGITASADNSEIEFGFADIAAGTTLSTVDLVEILFRVKTQPFSPVPYEVYYDNGSTETLVGSGTCIADAAEYSQPILVSMTTEPVTLVTWTKTQINAAKFKFKITEAVTTTIEFCSMRMQGTTNSSTVQIDTVAAEVIAPGNTTTALGLKNKLVLSNISFLKLNPEVITITDVTNSVASSSLPSLAPFDLAVLYGQVYVVNGVNPTKRYPNSSVVFESLTTNDGSSANPLTGRTVCAFADRILYGYTRDNTTYTPERIAYSQIRNGGVHNHVSAGTIDIIDSMGGIVALRTLNETMCFAAKEKGIYTLRRTGNSIAPIIVDPLDYETGCLSQFSAVRALLKTKPVILFFGENSTAGLNIFAFDGEAVFSVGDAINPFLEQLCNPKMFSVTIGAVDPRTNSYVVFFSPGQEIERSLAFSMNLNTGAWTRWDLPYSIYSAALWHFSSETRVTESAAAGNLIGEPYYGIPTLVVGGRNNLPLKAHVLPYDSLTAAQDDGVSLAAPFLPGHVSDQTKYNEQKSVFTSTIETGDIQLIDPQLGEQQMMSFRLHMDYVNYGPVRFEAATSSDGGVTYTTDTAFFIGDMSKDGSSRHALIDLTTPVNDRKVRFRIKAEPTSSLFELPFFWQIDRIFIEYQQAGLNGP
jgi:hypothetical protein